MKKITAIIIAFILIFSEASISYAEDIRAYPEEGGNLYYDHDRGVATTMDLNVKSLVIPSVIDGVKIKGIEFNDLPHLPLDGAYAMNYLETVTIQDGVEYIADESFRECNPLKSVIIPDSVTSIGEGAFFDCHYLESIRLPSKLERIEVGTFAHSSLTSIKIPDSVTYIGDGAFSNSAISDITLPPGIKEIASEIFAGSGYLEDINIPYGVTSIGDGAFEFTGLKDINIPDTVSYIGNDAFLCCGDLLTTTIPSSVTYIGENAFDSCSEQLVLKVEADSYALQYAKSNGFKYEIINPIKVMLNGSKLSFDQTPFIENGTTFVPMRTIFEAMGAAVDWNSATQTVTAKKDGTNISLTINNKTAKVNGNNKSLNAAPKLVNGSTMVPLRFVGESLGAVVNWDDGSRTVSINS